MRTGPIANSSPITFSAGPDTKGVLFGLVWAIGIDPGHYPPDLDDRLRGLVEARKDALTPEEDATRKAARDILRHGKYKPTGRGKPASEYLVRVAGEDRFPRITPPVDICNYISLKYLVSASVWDLDLAGPAAVARRGREGESYVFNASEQEIGLQDLLLLADGSDRPMVNPVKDSHRTKTHPATTSVAGVVYIPAAAGVDAGALLEEFAGLLGGCGNPDQVGHQLVEGRL